MDDLQSHSCRESFQVNQFDSHHMNHLFGLDNKAVAHGCFCQGNSFLSASVPCFGRCYVATWLGVSFFLLGSTTCNGSA